MPKSRWDPIYKKIRIIISFWHECGLDSSGISMFNCKLVHYAMTESSYDCNAIVKKTKAGFTNI